MAIGIERLAVYPCTLVLSIRELCVARGLDDHNFCERLLCDERSVVGPFEDVVTLAVNAAHPMLTDADRARIRLLIVATESAPDQAKPVSSWVHRFLGLHPQCRNFDVKHACYAAAAAVQLATAWLATADDDGAALVIAADHACIGLGTPQEPVLGAGAAALVLSRQPQILAFDIGWSGVYAHEVPDIFRPAPGVEAGDADESLLSYLDAVALAYDAYVESVGRPVDFDQFFAAHIYHVPFGGLAQRAHVRLAQRALGLSRAEAECHWRRKSQASLTYNRRVGGVYSASTFVALAGLIARSPERRTGDRIAIYSYGSGSCAEFSSGTLLDSAQAAIAEGRIEAALDARRPLTLADYEACERALFATTTARNMEVPIDVFPALYDEHYAGRGKLVFRGTRDYFRDYAWS
jgi:hydroxymethylglutaryl-CoA synthase